MASIPEYKVEQLFIERLKNIGYQYVELRNYSDVLANLRMQLAAFNHDKLVDKKGTAEFSDTEFSRIMNHLDNHTVYESAKILRDKYVLTLDNGQTVYIEFFGSDMNRNVYQVAHQITMDKDHLDDVVYKNRYDVTIIINGLPLVQIELKRPGVEINEAINQINRYRAFSFRGLFHFLQIFVVSNSDQTKYFCNENETVDGKYNPILKSLVFFWTDDKNKRINKLDDFTADFFRKTALTQMLAKYMVIKTTDPTLMVMRPYQIFAVKAAQNRILAENQNGYVFACTGSGKTLTSFKLAQLLRDEPSIDKVIFLIDRKDLDDQTIDEYNSFEKDCVDNSTSTAVLVKQLKDTSKGMIVTTIQKLAHAVNSSRYATVMDYYADKRVVFIIDECHRSQFGKMHADIARHFKKARFIGFTGTPIFEENKTPGGQTTADVFNAGPKLDACLHKYMIKDAIADGNVLRFSVEYERTISNVKAADPKIDAEKLDDPEYCKANNIDMDSLYHDPERIRKVSEDLLEHHEQHTHPQGKDVYTAIFAVDSIKTLGMYYDTLRALNSKRENPYRIAAIFTYQANEDMEADEGVDEHSQALLDRCIDDYNKMFGTSFDSSTFDAYRKDISKRMKQKDLPQIDILLVVNMMLTGFDAKCLNTLYLDKNLVWHSLLQAYSRTNRVDKVTKQYGQIVTYRNIKKAQDDALRLFSGDGDPNEYLMQNYEYYVKQYMDEASILRHVADTPEDAGDLKSEDDIRHFIIAFREVAKTLSTMKTFSKFDWHDINTVLPEQDYDSYKSWYLYFKDQQGGGGGEQKVPVPVDVDFDIELIRTDRINVLYILNLLRKAKEKYDGNVNSKTDEKRQEERNADIDLIMREVERSDNDTLRLKKDLIKDFIETVFFNLPVGVDVEPAYEQYEKERQDEEIRQFAEDNSLDVDDMQNIYSTYQFKGTISKEDIREKLGKYHLSLLKVTALINKIINFVKTTYQKFKAEGE